MSVHPAGLGLLLAAASVFISACTGSPPTVSPTLTISPTLGVLPTRPLSPTAPSTPTSSALEKTTPATTLPSAGKVIATIPVGAAPLPLAIGAGAVWVRNGEGKVLRIDPTTNQVVATIPVGGTYGYISIGEGAVWVSQYDSDMVLRIDPATNEVVAKIPVGSSPEGIGVTPGAVWVANHHDGSVSRIDPVTNKVANTIMDVGLQGDGGPLVLVTGAGSVWVEVPNINALMRIDPATNVAEKVGPLVGGIGTDSASAWYGTGSGVSRIGSPPNQTATTVALPFPIQRDTAHVAVGLGSVWFKNDQVLVRINPKTNQISGELPIPGIGDIAIGEGAVWVGVEDTQSLLRIEPAP